MTREQLSRRERLTGAELKVRNREILRLLASGLYNCTQIAEAYNRSPRLIGRIRAENKEQVNPWMTISESAEYLKVSPSVIVALIDKMHIKACTFQPEDSPGATLNGASIHLAVRKAWLFQHKDRWGSAKDAAEKANISRKGMETRARQGRAEYLEAPGGKTFTVDGQAGLRYIYDLEQISPAISEQKEGQLEMPLEPKKEEAKPKCSVGEMIRVSYKSDVTESMKQLIRCDRELDITMFHTKGKCSKVTRIHIEWDKGKGQPRIDILTPVPVTVRRTRNE